MLAKRGAVRGCLVAIKEGHDPFFAGETLFSGSKAGNCLARNQELPVCVLDVEQPSNPMADGSDIAAVLINGTGNGLQFRIIWKIWMKKVLFILRQMQWLIYNN